MIVGVPVETYPSERRVALVPSVAADLAKDGLEVVVQQGAGEKAGVQLIVLPATIKMSCRGPVFRIS